jgi:DNA-binding transcriptional MerR regulator
MRMAELSRASGVPVATIKYYLREELLPAGERTSPNQASYDDSHVRRLRLIRAMLDTGGLSVAAAKEVVAALDAPDLGIHQVLGVAQRALISVRDDVTPADREWASERVEALARDRDWHVKPGEPSTDSLVAILATFRELGREQLLEHFLDSYARVADELARVDLHSLGDGPAESTVETMVVASVLTDALLAALRKVAQVNASARRFEGDGLSR